MKKPELPFKFFKQALLLSAVVCTVFIFWLAVAHKEPNSQEDNKQAKASNPSKYGLLTSARWAWGAAYKRQDLTPIANPNPNPEPQPHRDHPFGLALSADGRKAYVSLSGSENHPGNQVAVFDVETRKVIKKIPVRLFIRVPLPFIQAGAF